MAGLILETETETITYAEDGHISVILGGKK